MIIAVCITEVEVATALLQLGGGHDAGQQRRHGRPLEGLRAPSTATPAKMPRVGSQPCQMPRAMMATVTRLDASGR